MIDFCSTVPSDQVKVYSITLIPGGTDALSTVSNHSRFIRASSSFDQAAENGVSSRWWKTSLTNFGASAGAIDSGALEGGMWVPKVV
jgi:hypothetical protein